MYSNSQKGISTKTTSQRLPTKLKTQKSFQCLFDPFSRRRLFTKSLSKCKSKKTIVSTLDNDEESGGPLI